MRARTLLGSFLFILMAAGLAFSQAIAEAVAVHAGSAAATAKAGTALGNAVSKATGNVARQIQTATQSNVAGGQIQEIPQTKGQPAAAVNKTSSSSGGLRITSIRGAHQNCPAPAPAQASKPGTSSDGDVAGQTRDCAPVVQSQSKSVINLRFSR